jgi:[protein-PII] uridylyltransferase
VIEVNGRDRPGLLFEITLALTRLNLMIHGARIATFGERAVDVFYVQDVLGDKIEDPAKLRRIQKRLLEALANPECKPAAPAAEKAGKDAAKTPAAKAKKTAKGEAAAGGKASAKKKTATARRRGSAAAE